MDDSQVAICVVIILFVVFLFGCFTASRVDASLRDNCIEYASDMTVTEANKFCDNVLYGKKK